MALVCGGPTPPPPQLPEPLSSTSVGGTPEPVAASTPIRARLATSAENNTFYMSDSLAIIKATTDPVSRDSSESGNNGASDDGSVSPTFETAIGALLETVDVLRGVVDVLEKKRYT